jgi:hypothetical protein
MREESRRPRKSEQPAVAKERIAAAAARTMGQIGRIPQLQRKCKMRIDNKLQALDESRLSGDFGITFASWLLA